MYTLSPTPIPNAPPEAPSNNYGDDRTFKRIISNMFLAMASPAHAPRLLNQDKPGVSINVKTECQISLPFSLNATFYSLLICHPEISILTHLSIDSFC
jgi:hypothetical protein